MPITDSEKGEIIMWVLELEHQVQNNTDAMEALSHLKQLVGKALDITLLM